MFALTQSSVIACPPWRLEGIYGEIHPVVATSYNSFVTDDIVYECLYRERRSFMTLPFSQGLHYSEEYVRLMNDGYLPFHHVSECYVATIIRSQKFSRRGKQLMQRLFSYNEKTKFAFEFIINY